MLYKTRRMMNANLEMIHAPIEDWFVKLTRAEIGDWFEGFGIVSYKQKHKVRAIGKAACEILKWRDKK